MLAKWLDVDTTASWEKLNQSIHSAVEDKTGSYVMIIYITYYGVMYRFEVIYVIQCVCTYVATYVCSYYLCVYTYVYAEIYVAGLNNKLMILFNILNLSLGHFVLYGRC